MRTARDLLRLNVKRLREAMRWDQPELADKAHLSSQMVAKIEQAKTNPSLDTLDKLVKGLKTNHAELFLDDTLSRPVPQSIADLTPDEMAQKIAQQVEVRQKALSPIPPEIWAAWKGSVPEIKALCYYMFLERYDFVAALPEKKRAKVLAAVRALGLNLPEGPS